MRELGRTEEASRSFARAASKAPEDPTPHLELASLALLRGDTLAAQNSLQHAIKLKPNGAATGALTSRIEDAQARLANDADSTAESQLR